MDSATFVLAPETNNNSAGTNGDVLQQRSYIAGVHEWYFCQDKDYALLYLGAYEGHETMPPLLDSVQCALSANAQMSGYGSTTMTSLDVRDHLVSSRIFSCVTHGFDSHIVTTDGKFTIDDVNALPKGFVCISVGSM